jgi:hypothetical protein
MKIKAGLSTIFVWAYICCHVLMVQYSYYRRACIDSWIYWTQLNYTTRDYTLQFTVRHTHTDLLSPGVFSLVVTSQLTMSLYSSGLRTSCRPTHSLRTVDSLSAPAQGRLLLWRLFNPQLTRNQSQSQSYFTTDDQSVSKSWFQGPWGSHDRIFISVDIYEYNFLDYWRPLWREVGSVISSQSHITTDDQSVSASFFFHITAGDQSVSESLYSLGSDPVENTSTLLCRTRLRRKQQFLPLLRACTLPCNVLIL